MFSRLCTVASWKAEGNVSLFWAWDIRFCGFWADWKRGLCVFPWLSVWRCFYSKADCTVSGCLYTISIIMEEEQPLPHALPPVWRPLSASQSVTFFFFLYYSDWLFFTRCFSAQGSSVCFWLLHSSAWFIHSFLSMTVDAWVGKLADTFVWDIYVCLFTYVCVCW